MRDRRLGSFPSSPRTSRAGASAAARSRRRCPAASSLSSSSKIRTSKYSSLITPAAFGRLLDAERRPRRQARLGQAVRAAEHVDAEALAERAVDLHRHRRGADEAQRRVRLGRARVRHLGAGLVVREQVRHRAEQRHDRARRPGSSRARSPTPRTCPRSPTRPPHDERADEAGGERVEVEQRQRRPHDVVGGATPADRDLASLSADVVVVAQHAALRRAGRAAGVDERREVARARRRCSVRSARSRAGRPTGAPSGPRSRRRARRRRSRARGVSTSAAIARDRVGEVGLHDDDARAGVGELVAEVVALVRRVDRRADRARTARCPTTRASPRASSP